MNKEFYEIHSAEYEEQQEVLREMTEDDDEITEYDAEMLFEEYDEDDALYDYEYGDDDVGFNPYLGCYDFDC